MCTKVIAAVVEFSRPAGPKSGLVRRGGRRREAHFALDPLIELLEARNENSETIPGVLGISNNVFRNLKARGVTWARADELAVRCGLFPWQVWPEWSAVDPEQWMGPSCPANHGWSEMVPNPDLRGEYCRVCKANAEAAEVQAA